MSIGIACNPCSNGFCGNCVGEKLETTGFIHDAKFHCKCASDGHPNRVTKERPNKEIFSKKRDDYTPPAEIKEIDETE